MARTINARQLKSLYWPAWNAAAKALKERAGYTKDELEDFRKETHREVTGRDCSSKDLTNRQLDGCLMRFEAIARPFDGKRQADLADMACARLRWKIGEIRRSIGVGDSYVDTISITMHRCSIIQCDEAQLLNVLRALKIQLKRQRDKAAEPGNTSDAICAHDSGGLA